MKLKFNLPYGFSNKNLLKCEGYALLCYLYVITGVNILIRRWQKKTLQCIVIRVLRTQWWLSRRIYKNESITPCCGYIVHAFTRIMLFVYVLIAKQYYNNTVILLYKVVVTWSCSVDTLSYKAPIFNSFLGQYKRVWAILDITFGRSPAIFSCDVKTHDYLYVYVNHTSSYLHKKVQFSKIR